MTWFILHVLSPTFLTVNILFLENDERQQSGAAFGCM